MRVSRVVGQKTKMTSTTTLDIDQEEPYGEGEPFHAAANSVRR